jgi:hypothetical protein
MSTVPILIAEDDQKNIVIDRPSIVVGRSRRRSDVRIDDQSISAVHCEIEVGENCLQVRNRGRNGIRINGEKSDEGVLRDGDVFEIARMKYRVLMEGDSGYPNASKLSHSNDWFVRLAGMELGPMPWAELSLMAQRGELTESDEVRWSRQRNWRPAATADGLFDTEPSADEKSEPRTDAHSGSQIHPAADQGTTRERAEESPIPEGEDADQSWDVEIDAVDESVDTSAHDRDSLTDTVTDVLDETATSGNTFRLAGPTTDDSNEIEIDSEVASEPGSDHEWRLDDADSEAEGTFEPRDAEPRTASFPNSTEASLPPLPVPPPVNVAPQPAPYKPPPMPKIGRSNTLLDVVYDSVLGPVFDRIPLLRTWPGVATVVAALVVAVLMMLPAYEGTDVSGRVTLNGQPLTDATISFTDLKNGFGASAIVGPDGTFEVATLKGGMKPGAYSVAVMPLKPESPDVVSELQRQFSESQNGGMHVEEAMMEGAGEPGYRPSRSSEESEKETFELPATTIPFQYRSIQTSDISQEITEDGPNELLIELVAIPD